MSAADEFFRALGLEPVEVRVARMAATAKALHNGLSAGFFKNQLATVNRWAFRQLDLCARTFGCPAPDELVRLLAHLLGADRPERDGARKNRDKFIAAAHHVAAHPNATPSQIARAIKYQQKRIIRSWLCDEEFNEIVNTRRVRLSYQQRRGT